MSVKQGLVSREYTESKGTAILNGLTKRVLKFPPRLMDND